MLYDELTEMMDSKTLHPTIMEWSVDLNNLQRFQQFEKNKN